MPRPGIVSLHHGFPGQVYISSSRSGQHTRTVCYFPKNRPFSRHESHVTSVISGNMAQGNNVSVVLRCPLGGLSTSSRLICVNASIMVWSGKRDLEIGCKASDSEVDIGASFYYFSSRSFFPMMQQKFLLASSSSSSSWRSKRGRRKRTSEANNNKQLGLRLTLKKCAKCKVCENRLDKKWPTRRSICCGVQKED
jgi:hypothetical protein